MLISKTQVFSSINLLCFFFQTVFLFVCVAFIKAETSVDAENEEGSFEPKAVAKRGLFGFGSSATSTAGYGLVSKGGYGNAYGYGNPVGYSSYYSAPQVSKYSYQIPHYGGYGSGLGSGYGSGVGGGYDSGLSGVTADFSDYGIKNGGAYGGGYGSGYGGGYGGNHGGFNGGGFGLLGGIGGYNGGRPYSHRASQLGGGYVKPGYSYSQGLPHYSGASRFGNAGYPVGYHGGYSGGYNSGYSGLGGGYQSSGGGYQSVGGGYTSDVGGYNGVGSDYGVVGGYGNY